MRRPIVGIVGAGDAGERSLRNARELGRLVAAHGWIVLTGGRPDGVMAAACAGAKEVPGSLTLGILPSAAGSVDPNVDVAVFTGMGDARNAINVLTSDAIVACGLEGAGTASEVAYALKAAKPVVLLAAGPAAVSFFRALQGGDRVLEADSPGDAALLLERKVGLGTAAPLGRPG